MQKKNNITSKAEIWIKKEVYGEAPEQHHFIVSNGKKLKNLKELIEEIENMPDSIFKSHVNNYKNDFSKWVKDIFKEDFLAEELKKTDNQIETELKLQRHINKKLNEVIKKLAK
ncbi:hypothetical protein J4440_00670 [Candidatus Woesearchaeota archaeon]|nr:hypothetical protein [Candidatus Woesearchaeota archaeon]